MENGEARLERIRSYTLDDEATLQGQLKAFSAEIKELYPMGGPNLYDLEFKMGVITLWALSGCTLTELGRRVGVPYKTIKGWHNNFEPVDWDAHRDMIVTDKMRAASKVVARRFGEILNSSLEATTAITKSLNFAIAEIQKDMKDLQEDEVIKPGDKRRRTRVRELVSMLNETTRAMKSIQDQQFTVFGVPSIQRETNPAVNGNSGAMGTDQLEKLSDDQITRLLAGQDGSSS